MTIVSLTLKTSSELKAAPPQCESEFLTTLVFPLIFSLLVTRIGLWHGKPVTLPSILQWPNPQAFYGWATDSPICQKMPLHMAIWTTLALITGAPQNCRFLHFSRYEASLRPSLQMNINIQ